MLRTSGSTDTEAKLHNGGLSALGLENDGSHMGDGGNFWIAGVFATGTYYVEMTGSGGATRAYAMHLETVADTTWQF